MQVFLYSCLLGTVPTSRGIFRRSLVPLHAGMQPFECSKLLSISMQFAFQC